MKEKIEAILVKYDPVKLIKMGAPQDEYDSEAQMIYERTTRHFSLEKIHEIVYDVFVKQFTGGTKYKMEDGEMTSLGEVASSWTRAKSIIGFYEDYRCIALAIKELLDQENARRT